MPTRYREKITPAIYEWRYWDGVIRQSPYNVRTESFYDPLPGPGPCSHTKSTVCTVGYRHNASGNFDRWIGHVLVPDDSAIAIRNVEQMNWDKLPSSTKTGIIQILAELDEIVSMFARRFWTSLSYGSFTWGVVPFVSDLLAVVEAVSNLSTNLSDFAYEDQFTVPLPPEPLPPQILYEGNPARFKGNLWLGGEAKIRYTGRADMSFQAFGSRALDWLGFHPDLATAWDLIPFSFVVDYLFPIGDFLEQFRSGGWVKTIYFTGWQTVKITGQVKYLHEFTGYTSTQGISDYSSFTRNLGGFVLVVDTDSSIDLGFTPPSFREMFNMIYLLANR